jgi:hypothetical protein
MDRVKLEDAEPLLPAIKLESAEPSVSEIKLEAHNIILKLKTQPSYSNHGIDDAPSPPVSSQITAQSSTNNFIDLTLSPTPLPQPKPTRHHFKQEKTPLRVIDLCMPSPSPSPPPPLRLLSPSLSDSDSDRGGPEEPANRPESAASDDNFNRYQEKLAADGVRPTVEIGSVFPSWEVARNAVFAAQEQVSFRWHIAQSKQTPAGLKKKVTLQCQQYYEHKPVHSADIDPGNFRESKSVQCGCMAHVNVNRLASTGLQYITLADFNHTHNQELPPGSQAPVHPTQAQKDLVVNFVSTIDANFNRTQIAAILNATSPTNPLEPRQISNLINEARAQQARDIKTLGGDVASILANLQQLKDEDPQWTFDIRLDSTQCMVVLWWQSPTQAELTQCYSDVLLNDNTYNHNQYGYPLNIGIGIDNFGHSWNLWYCFQECEDIETHVWVLQRHIQSSSVPSQVFISDRHLFLA